MGMMNASRVGGCQPPVLAVMQEFRLLATCSPAASQAKAAHGVLWQRCSRDSRLVALPYLQAALALQHIAGHDSAHIQLRCRNAGLDTFTRSVLFNLTRSLQAAANSTAPCADAQDCFLAHFSMVCPPSHHPCHPCLIL